MNTLNNREPISINQIHQSSHILNVNKYLMKKHKVSFQQWIEENQTFINISFSKFLKSFEEYNVKFTICNKELFRKYIVLLYSNYIL